MILEFGVLSGGTTRRLAFRYPDQKVYGFDWFWGLPEDWAKLPKGALSRQGQPPDGMPRNVELVIGLIEDTLPPFLEEHEGAVEFVHIDTDVYSTCAFILNQLRDRMKEGTVIVFDEYRGYDGYEDYEYRAFEEFKHDNPDMIWEEIQLGFSLGFNKVEEAAFELVKNGSTADH